MKHIEDIETDKCQLEVYECECGFHTGFDYTYLDQVDNIETACPSCGKQIFIPSTDQ